MKDNVRALRATKTNANKQMSKNWYKLLKQILENGTSDNGRVFRNVDATKGKRRMAGNNKYCNLAMVADPTTFGPRLRNIFPPMNVN